MDLNLRKSSKHRISRMAGWSWQSGLHRAVLREGLGELRKEPSRGVVTGAALASPQALPGEVCWPAPPAPEVAMLSQDAGSATSSHRACFPFLDSLV